MSGRVLTASVLGALALGAAPAAAAAPTVEPGSGYLALGDSVTFGYMEPTVVPGPNYRKPSSFVAYPEQLGGQLRPRVTNPACPGETSASLINRNAPSNGCENAYRKRYPLQVRYKGSQLAYAVSYLRAHRDTRLVSLANDLFRWQKTTPDHCLGRATFAAALHKVSGNVRKIVSTIRARYWGQLVIVNYYSLNDASALVNSEVRALNDAVDRSARPFRARFADGFGLFRTAAVHSGSDPCKGGLLTQLSRGGCGRHPSYAGQALLA